jgi:hypothetical protein
MYQTGVFKDPTEVLRAYMDIGYNLEKATKLTEFTLREYSESEVNASKTDVLTAYKLGRMTRDEAYQMLLDLDYQDWIADVYLTRIDFEVSNEEAAEVIKYTKTMYVNGQLTKTQVTERLAKIPLPASEISQYLEVWDISREAKEGRPTKAELKSMFTANLLDEADYRRELAGHHLSDDYVDWYVEAAKLDLAEAALKEAERADKEADRVRKDETKGARDIALADLDTQIAGYNVAIADIKLAVVKGMKAEEVERAKEWIAAYQLEIASLKEQKARIREETLIELQGGK